MKTVPDWKNAITAMRAMAAPVARIVLRYGVGLVAGAAIGNQLAADTELVLVVAGVVTAAIEGFYALAKSKGWAT